MVAWAGILETCNPSRLNPLPTAAVDMPPPATPRRLQSAAITSWQPTALEAGKAHPLLLLIILKR